MNLLRQREDLKRAQEAGCISKAQLEMALSSPVFCWPSGTEPDGKRKALTPEEDEYLIQHLMYVDDIPPSKEHSGGQTMFPKLTPYECFRISYTDIETYEQWWIGDHKALCFHCDVEHKPSGAIVKTWAITGITRGSPFEQFWLWMNEYKVSLTGVKDGDRVQLKGGISMVMKSDLITSFLGSLMRYLGIFLFEIMGSQSVVLRVRDKTEGKSVQWHQAREHYLVLHHNTAKSCQQGKLGVSHEDIIRGAHWRRAHLRRLSSDKFKHKKGLLVPVKKAWVGPEEWIGHDQKIYKVTHFNPQHQ